jgi:4-hydroxy 2-oxovalerate aldolase
MGLKFLRIGTNAGDGKTAKKGITLVKSTGMKACYSLMKSYLLSPEELAEEAVELEGYGVDEITIMDSAGTMTPNEVSEYVARIVESVKIPVGFHGHNNLGLSVANAMAAEKAGASILDCSLMGMARSAGNLPTEIAVAILNRQGKLPTIDFYKLLSFIDDKLAPAMETYNYKSAISPIELILGFSGCHSNYTDRFKQISEDYKVPLYPLIAKVTEIDRKAPSDELIINMAKRIVRSYQH